jgi:phosphoglycerate kinase
MPIRTVDQIDLKGKRVFIRVDFNVPVDDKNNVTDDTRILLSLPTIRFVMEAGGKVVLASHLGRPKGKRDPKVSLAPVAEGLSKLLGT